MNIREWPEKKNKAIERTMAKLGDIICDELKLGYREDFAQLPKIDSREWLDLAIRAESAPDPTPQQSLVKIINLGAVKLFRQNISLVNFHSAAADIAIKINYNSEYTHSHNKLAARLWEIFAEELGLVNEVTTARAGNPTNMRGKSV